MNPRVSVVLPTYNRPSELYNAIVSVIDQSFDDFELIVVDDSSDTDTRAVIDSFNDPRINLIEHEQNRGGSAARNTGINNASGEYVAFLDDDDRWVSHKLEDQVKLMDETECDASYTDFKFVSEYRISNIVQSILPNKNNQKKSGGEDLIPYILSGELLLGGASTIMIRRTILKKIDGFDESYDRLQDWEFIIRLLETVPISHIDNELVIKVGYNPPSGESIKKSWKQIKEDFPRQVEKANNLGLEPEKCMMFEVSRAYLREGKIIKGFQSLPYSQIQNGRKFLGLVFSLILGIYHKIKNSTS